MKSRLDLRSESYLGRHGRPVERQSLEIMTRSLEMAQEVWAQASEQDVGDLKIYYNPRSRKETAEAEKVFENAKRQGIRFILVAADVELDGKLLDSWGEVKTALKEAKKKGVKAQPVGVSRVAGG
jgi:hypothetical protein